MSLRGHQKTEPQGSDKKITEHIPKYSFNRLILLIETIISNIVYDEMK